MDNNKTRRKTMKDALSNVNGWVGGIVGLLKTVIVFFVFVNVLYTTNVDPIGGITRLVESFTNGGLSGLLALLVFASFLD